MNGQAGVRRRTVRVLMSIGCAALWASFLGAQEGDRRAALGQPSCATGSGPSCRSGLAAGVREGWREGRGVPAADRSVAGLLQDPPSAPPSR